MVELQEILKRIPHGSTVRIDGGSMHNIESCNVVVGDDEREEFSSHSTDQADEARDRAMSKHKFGVQEIKKPINEIKKYFIFTPPNQRTISPLEAIQIDVPRSG